MLVAGGGPAGLMAALAAGRAGARVIVADEQSEPGGSLLSERAEIDGRPAAEWVAGVLDELAAMPEVTLLPRTTVAGYYDHNFLTMAERVTDHLGGEPDGKTPRQRFWQVRAKQVVLATGAIERPLAFLDNDRPGVMLAGAVRSYVNRYAVLPGRRAVVFTNNDSAYETALDLSRAGASVTVVDLRKAPRGASVDAARAAGVEILDGHAITRVSGGKRVSGVTVRPLNDSRDDVTGGSRSIACDLVAMSGGWNPTVHLFSQSRGKLRFDDGLAAFVPGTSFADERSAGACNGVMLLVDCLREGAAAGAAAARDAGFEGATAPAQPAVEAAQSAGILPAWLVPSGRKLGRGGKHFIDFQNDVTAADLCLAHREGYVSVEHLKRYTTTGMGTDQGKTSNVNALGVVSETTGVPIGDLGTTTFRPPYTPVTFGAWGGRDYGELFDPVRKTPMHSWHERAGAVFENVGLWKRPWYYPRAGETMGEAVTRESAATRDSVGILDASTLGKIDVQGPDAAEFLNRVYVNGWLKLPVGKARYGVMLRDDGFVLDDGTTSRISEQHYFMTTTTAEAGPVMSWLEYLLETAWTDLRVHVTSVSDQWAAVAVAGPRSRHVLEAALAGVDVSDETLPPMGVRDAETDDGLPVRVLRVSFSGERAYEVYTPSGWGVHLLDRLLEAGAAFGLEPYGLEALAALRIEKGHPAGPELDGRTTLEDIGLGRMDRGSKRFVGDVLRKRPGLASDQRRSLVGIEPLGGGQRLRAGALVYSEDEPAEGHGIGHVTSVTWSPSLGHWIALALVAGGSAREGETVKAVSLVHGEQVRVRVVAPVFLDPAGERIHA